MPAYKDKLYAVIHSGGSGATFKETTLLFTPSKDWAIHYFYEYKDSNGESFYRCSVMERDLEELITHLDTEVEFQNISDVVNILEDVRSKKWEGYEKGDGCIGIFEYELDPRGRVNHKREVPIYEYYKL